MAVFLLDVSVSCQLLPRSPNVFHIIPLRLVQVHQPLSLVPSLSLELRISLVNTFAFPSIIVVLARGTVILTAKMDLFFRDLCHSCHNDG